MFSVNYKYLSLFLVALAIYLLWMDVGLYLELQKFQARTPGNLLPPLTNRSVRPSYTFSPFQPITVKLLMLPATIQYVDEPLGYLTVYHTRIAHFVSPNAVSLTGVGVAAVSARFIASQDLRYRQLGALLFKVRDYLDGLDGNVARERSLSHSIGQVANPNSFGWMVDGVCDGFGDGFRFIAFIIVLHRVLSGGKGGSTGDRGAYTLLDLGTDTGNICPLPHSSGLRIWLGRLHRYWVTYRRAVIVIVCVGFQSLYSSILWNYFMINYHRVLETDQYWGDVNYSAVAETQASILRSSSMWMVCYFWRLINPQMITQIQLLAILYDREVDLLLAVQLLGYLPITLVSLGSYLHLGLAEEAVRNAAFS